jgi:hypothetical protein
MLVVDEGSEDEQAAAAAQAVLEAAEASNEAAAAAAAEVIAAGGTEAEAEAAAAEAAAEAVSGVTCGNGLLDDTESDVDCGGKCTPCDAGRTCLVDQDCASVSCVESACVTLLPTDIAKTEEEMWAQESMSAKIGKETPTNGKQWLKMSKRSVISIASLGSLAVLMAVLLFVVVWRRRTVSGTGEDGMKRYDMYGEEVTSNPIASSSPYMRRGALGGAVAAGRGASLSEEAGIASTMGILPSYHAQSL